MRRIAVWCPRLCTLVALLLFALPVHGTTSNPISNSDYVKNLRYFDEASLAERVLPEDSFERLMQFLSEKHVRTKADLVREMRKSAEWEPMTRFFVPMRESKSSQKDHVSAKQPRIILFHPDKGLTIALVKGSDTVEILNPSIKEARHRVHTIQLKNGGAIPNENPKTCARCHGQTFLRPNYHNYRFWPGQYKADDDRFTPPEPSRWEAFLKEGAKEDFFQYLQFPEGSDPFRRGLMLTQHLHQTNHAVLAARLLKPEFWNAYKFAFAGLFSGCSDIDTFLPADLRKAHEARLGGNLSQVRAETRKIVDRNEAFKKSADSIVGEVLDRENKQSVDLLEENLTSMSSLRYLMDGQEADAALRASSFALSFDPDDPEGTFATSDGAIVPLRDLWNLHLKPVAEADPEFASTKDEGGGFDCGKLRSESVGRLKQRRILTVPADRPPKTPARRKKPSVRGLPTH